MIIKEYDLEEEKSKYPYSIHRCRIDRNDDQSRSCYVEYQDRVAGLHYPDEFFSSLSDDDIMDLTVHYFANHSALF